MLGKIRSTYNKNEDEFRKRGPCATEGVVLRGDPEREANRAVGRNDFEKNTEDGKARRDPVQMVPLDDADEKEGEQEPPQIVGELFADV